MQKLNNNEIIVENSLLLLKVAVPMRHGEINGKILPFSCNWYLIKGLV